MSATAEPLSAVLSISVPNLLGRMRTLQSKTMLVYVPDAGAAVDPPEPIPHGGMIPSVGTAAVSSCCSRRRSRAVAGRWGHGPAGALLRCCCASSTQSLAKSGSV